MQNGTDGQVNIVKTDSYGNVYIGGSFTQAGNRKTGPFAMWNSYTNKWIDTGLSNSDFTPGSVITAIDIDCSYTNSTFTGFYPCNILVGGSFQVKIASGEIAKNILLFNNKYKRWEDIGSIRNITLNVIKVAEVQISGLTKFILGGKFFHLGIEYGLCILDVYINFSNVWTMVEGAFEVTDISYISTDYSILVSAKNFTNSQCSGEVLCKFFVFKQTWSSQVGSISSGSVTKVRYLNGIVESNVGSIIIGGKGIPLSSVKKRDGEGMYNVIGRVNYPTQDETIFGMDVCGMESQYEKNGCKAGSILVGGENYFKFYDSNAVEWKSLLSKDIRINSVTVHVPRLPKEPIVSNSTRVVNECGNLKVKVTMLLIVVFLMVSLSF